MQGTDHVLHHNQWQQFDHWCQVYKYTITNSVVGIAIGMEQD